MSLSPEMRALVNRARSNQRTVLINQIAGVIAGALTGTAIDVFELAELIIDTVEDSHA